MANFLNDFTARGGSLSWSTDVGPEYAYRIAEAVERVGAPLVSEGVLHEDLFKSAEGYMKKARLLQYFQGVSPSKLPQELKAQGIHVAGWQMGLVHEAMGLGKLGANTPDAVNRLAQAMPEQLGEDFVRRWAPGALKNKLISGVTSAPYQAQSATPDRFKRAFATAKKMEATRPDLYQGFSESFMSGVKSEVSRVGGEMRHVLEGRGALGTVSSAKPMKANWGEAALNFAKSNKGKIGLGLAAMALWAIQPGSKFSGKDDEYNTIEGLPHGGQGQRMRRMLTEFGSGWIGRAFGAGLHSSSIAKAAQKLGNIGSLAKAENLLIQTAEKGFWMKGSQIGKGGFGVASKAAEIGTGRMGVYKHVGPTKPFGMENLISSPAFSKELESPDRMKFMKGYMVPSSEAYARSVAEYGGMGVQHEAAMQRLAHKQYGSLVPEVYGTTSEGIVMEHAGRALTQEEKAPALKWLRGKWARMMGSRGPLPSSTSAVYHLDPQVQNIMKGPDGSYKLIDWGVATTEQLPVKARVQAVKAYDRYIKRMEGGPAQKAASTVAGRPKAMGPVEKSGVLAPQVNPGSLEAATVSGPMNPTPQTTSVIAAVPDPTRAKRAMAMQAKHKMAQIRSSSYAQRPGRRHTNMSKKIVY